MQAFVGARRKDADIAIAIPSVLTVQAIEMEFARYNTILFVDFSRQISWSKISGSPKHMCLTGDPRPPAAKIWPIICDILGAVHDTMQVSVIH